MTYVLHVAPLMFGPGGYWGGGERYPLELARAQAQLVPTRLVSFGESARRYRLEALEIHVLPVRTRFKGNCLNPLSELLLVEVADADIIHAHQTATALTDLVVILGVLLGKQVFVTDHGGSAPTFHRLLDTSRFVSGHMAVSEFAGRMSPEFTGRTHVIYGGANLQRFKPGMLPRRRAVVYVGRIMPHKGIHDLIDALEPDMPLEIFGRTYDGPYRRALDNKAAGKNVRFHDSASDDEIVDAFQTARVAVLPSVHTSEFGDPYPKPELLGLTLIEAMACGTPVIASSAASLPEVVVDGSTGFIFDAGDSSALRACLRRLWDDDQLWYRMSDAALTRVRDLFTWRNTAIRALEGYATARRRFTCQQKSP